MKEKILYADDEPDFVRLVTIFLKPAGYEILPAADGKEALELLGKNPDTGLVILDVMMPGMDGWTACKMIRGFSKVPVLMLTALGDESSEVKGLENGADDYISKPFSKKMLLSHVQALLRRASPDKAKTVSCGELVLNKSAHTVSTGSGEIALTFREYELLRHLMENADMVCTRSRLLSAVWGFYYDGDPRTLDTHIKSLRSKLGESGKAIETVRNVGYVFKEPAK
jgi:DNA-binding response OmpR family regulator